MTEQTDLVGAVPADQPLADWTDLVLALGGDDTSFTGDLLRLIAKADPGNQERLRLAFPWNVRAWELWMEHAPDITAGQLVARVDSDTLTAALVAAVEPLAGLSALRKAVSDV